MTTKPKGESYTTNGISPSYDIKIIFLEKGLNID